MSRHLFIYKFFIFCQPTSILRVCGLSMMAHGKECCQCKGHEFNPWSRRIPCASEEVSPCITTIEPALYSLGSTAAAPPLCHCCSPWQEKPLRGEGREPQPEQSLCRSKDPAEPQPRKESVQEQPKPTPCCPSPPRGLSSGRCRPVLGCRGPAPAGSRGTLRMNGICERETRRTGLDRAKSARERERKKERDQTRKICSRVWQLLYFSPSPLYPKLVHF